MLTEIYLFFKSLCDRIGNAIASLRRKNAEIPILVPQMEEAASVAEIELSEILSSEIEKIIPETFMDEEPELMDIEWYNEEIRQENPKAIEEEEEDQEQKEEDQEKEEEEEEEDQEEEETLDDYDHSSDEDYVYEEDEDDDDEDDEDEDDDDEDDEDEDEDDEDEDDEDEDEEEDE